MSARDIRSASPRDPSLRDASHRHRPIRSLLKACGAALRSGVSARASDDPYEGGGALEQLEARVMLSGDHPSFNDVFLGGQPASPVATDGTAAGGIISPSGDDDVFTFTPAATDFVRVWADTLSSAGSTLDSRVQVYTRDANNVPVVVASGSNNGTLTTGVFKDGWAGFVAQAGQQYWVQVTSDALAGGGSTGGYNLRVNGTSLAFPALNGTTGAGQIAGTLTQRGGDLVYKVTTGGSDLFNSLLTVEATANAALFDTRLDIYNSDGTPVQLPDTTVIKDDDSGNLSNSYLAFRGTKSTVYYIRVRSDQTATGTPATGAFNLLVDGIGTTIALNPVTRLGGVAASLANVQTYHFYTFQSQGTGRFFISLVGNGNPPIQDSALRLYDDTGTQVAFNELPGLTSQIVIDAIGGRQYYLVVENFDGVGGGPYRVEIEAHHTFTQDGDPNLDTQDDHANTPDGGLSLVDRLRAFEKATPVVWGPAVTDPVGGQPVVGPQWPGTIIPAGNATNHTKVVIGHATGRIYSDLPGGDTDLFQFVPPQDMLGTFGGLEIPGQTPPSLDWQAKYRPATRLQILVFPPTGFLNPHVRVYDSNLALVWDNQNLTTVGGAGMLDPASFRKPTLLPPGPLPTADPAGLAVWGGEVYYLEVSGPGDGRYNVEIMADAPRDTNLWSFGVTPTTAGNFASAMEVNINANSGDARNYANAAGAGLTIFPAPYGILLTGGAGDMGPQLIRSQFANRTLPNPPIAGTGANVPNPFTGSGTTGTRGRVIFEESDLGNIQSPSDTQLYKFRALYTGMAEVRLNTTQIQDEFFSGVATTETNDPAAAPPPTPPVITTTNLTRTYNSPLDGALRIFDNDFQQVAYNNDNSVNFADVSTLPVASFGNRSFWGRDPRTVFAVQAGKEYYIQVESGQAANAATPATVDWRHATGSYELLIDSMSNLLFADDHVNAFNQAQATPMPVDLSVTSTTANLGSVDGRLENAGDDDLFYFISPAAGTATFSVRNRTGTQADNFGYTITVTDALTQAVIGTATGAGGGGASVNVLAFKGQKFFVDISGDPAGTQGRYTVSTKGVPFRDDRSNDTQIGGAFAIDTNLYDFDKTETVSGRIENEGDTDVFSFDSLTYDLATISVHSRSGNFNPFVRVYEISEDPDGNPIRLQIGRAEGTPITDAQTTVSVTAPPRTSTLTGHSYHTYYIVVSGVDPAADFGDYDVTLTLGTATDDHPDQGQFAGVRPEDTITVGPDGTGGASGNIEQSGDTDLFQFSVSSSGTVTIHVISPPDSRLLETIQVFDGAGTQIGTLVVGPDDSQSDGTFSFSADRDATYFLLVGGQAAPGNTFKTDDHGRYLVTIGAPVLDDHPNAGEFTFADPISIAPSTGFGATTGLLEVDTDTDLFYFDALGTGTARITIDTPGSAVTPVLQLFDPTTSEIGSAITDGDAGDEDGAPNGSVTRTISVVAGGRYYILVSSNPQSTGGYSVTIHSPRPDNAPADDHPNAGEFDIADVIPLDPRSGDGTGTGLIEADGDTDLFFFTSLSGTPSRTRPAFVQVVTPNGQVLDVGVKIFGPNHLLIVSDDAGGPGFNAGVKFDINGANQQYWIEVDGLSGVGAYTVKVDTAPETYLLYYPEGFSNDNIHEYVVVANPNDFAVQYSLKIRYETTGQEVILADHVNIDPHTRGGMTISDGANGRLAGVEVNHGYSLIVESDGFVAANISHYDFHATLGEAFTNRTSDFWSFARGDRQPGLNRDFVIVYNPNPTPVVITFTAYKSDGSTFVMSQTVPGNTRGGWTLAGTPALGTGQFAFTVTSAPVTPGDSSGVVAALSHYDLVNNTGYGVLGNPDGGSTTGLVPGLITGGSVTTSVTFFNFSASTANVSIVGKYIGAGLPDLTKLITIGANSFVTLSGSDLGLTDNQLVGLRYDSDQPLTVLGGTIRPGSTPPDATTDTTQANTEVATSWFFGDAFINSRHAGDLYQENMFLYNPDVNPITVTLRFIFTDGFTVTHDVVVNGKDFAAVALHQLPEILNHRVFNFFGIEASSASPFAAKFNHYDLVLDGAWGTKGAALGITDPLSAT